MKFTFKIDSRDAAMCGGGRSEVARLLRKAAQEVEAGSEGSRMIEDNGNYCGDWDCDDERPDFENCEAADLFELSDDLAIILDDDPRKLSREALVRGLESVGCACYDDESDELLADAYGDSMLAGDLGGDFINWREVVREAWEQ